MEHITWGDRQGRRGRQAFLLLIAMDKNLVHVFSGKDIPGVVVIENRDYTKDGKWSHNTYELALANHVRPIAGHEGWNTGSFLEGMREACHLPHTPTKWLEVANALGVSIAEAQRFLRDYRPEEASRIDEVERAIEAMADTAYGDYEITTFSFGGPTCYEMEEGYWDLPVLVINKDGKEIGCITPSGNDWLPEGHVKLLEVERSKGRHGGYVSLRLAIPAGTYVVHEARWK